MAGPKQGTRATFKMANEDGDVVIADRYCCEAMEAKGYKRVTGSDVIPKAPGENKIVVDRKKLAGLSKDQLGEMLSAKGIDPRGNKPDLIERLADAGIGPITEA